MRSIHPFSLSRHSSPQLSSLQPQCVGRIGQQRRHHKVGRFKPKHHHDTITKQLPTESGIHNNTLDSIPHASLQQPASTLLNQQRDHSPPAQELSVLIIISALRLSATSSPLVLKAALTASTTRWKLLAAPFSWVNRAMLRGLRLPCSITVMISTANDTSLRSRSGRVKSVSCRSEIYISPQHKLLCQQKSQESTHNSSTQPSQK
jgi:hypothetical protein